MVEISVVIPVRNEEKNIEELIERLVKTFTTIEKTFEIIFVTDINTDHTVEKLDEFSKRDA